MAATVAGEGLISIDAGAYRVTIGASWRHDLATQVVSAAPAHHFAVVTDANVAPLHGQPIATALRAHGRVSLLTIPAGEASKSRGQWGRLTDQLLAEGCGRDTTIVAVGGGVVGDLAGFVAATYMRGVPVVQVPTSLLAMIDAAIGGKTGVDTPAGKNLVGAFHPPSAVLIDVDTIRTLPLPHRRAGLAEAIKHGVIADAGYLARVSAALPALLDADPSATRDCVARSVEIKAAVVREDPNETGRRRVLNFGHTLGHALEQASGYALLHGEAVAIGMVLEARVAERIGVAPSGTAEAVEAPLAAAGLPTRRPEALGRDAVLAATRADKKARAGSVTYALPAGIGRMAGGDTGWSIPVSDALVLEVLA